MLIANMERRQMRLFAELPGVDDPVFVDLPICPCFKRDDATKAPHMIATNCGLNPAGPSSENTESMCGAIDVQGLLEKRIELGLNQ